MLFVGFIVATMLCILGKLVPDESSPLLAPTVPVEASRSPATTKARSPASKASVAVNTISAPCQREQRAYEAWNDGQMPLFTAKNVPTPTELAALKADALAYLKVVTALPGETTELSDALERYLVTVRDSEGQSHYKYRFDMMLAGGKVDHPHREYQWACSESTS